ncbi:host-nuclease inhibitor Gam family protein [Bacillus spongiae]|uniref:Host-nuclease inhibitor Gam family protein n=1 Tax=Bacillus spongiae TaxID=2683610 RepID=A0ABU8HJG0_9BACI
MNELKKNETEKKPFEVTDFGSLNYAFKKISELKGKEQEVQSNVDTELERVITWGERELAPIRNGIKHFESLIEIYHSKKLEENPKENKTISTPYGKARARKVKETTEETDRNAILQHVQASGLDDYILPKLAWGELKKSLRIAEVNGEKVVVDELGQVVEGVAVKPESISYSVEVE